jgi:hypothetical protein
LNGWTRYLGFSRLRVKLVQDAKKIFQYSHAEPIVFSHFLLGVFKVNVVRKLATYLYLLIAKKVSLFGTL